MKKIWGGLKKDKEYRMKAMIVVGIKNRAREREKDRRPNRTTAVIVGRVRGGGMTS